MRYLVFQQLLAMRRVSTCGRRWQKKGWAVTVTRHLLAGTR